MYFNIVEEWVIIIRHIIKYPYKKDGIVKECFLKVDKKIISKADKNNIKFFEFCKVNTTLHSSILVNKSTVMSIWTTKS